MKCNGIPAIYGLRTSTDAGGLMSYGTNVPALYAYAATLPGIEPVGLATHIGSQIVDLASYQEAYARIADLFFDTIKTTLETTSSSPFGPVDLRRSFVRMRMRMRVGAPPAMPVYVRRGVFGRQVRTGRRGRFGNRH